MSATRGASYKPLFVMASRLQSLRPILFVIFCCLLILQVIVCVGGARLGSDGRADFRQFYTAGYMVRSGHANQIYDYDTEKMFQDRVVGPGSSFPFNHLAYEALLFVPLSFLAYRTAYWVYFALNLALLALATWRFKPYLSGLKAFAPWMPYATFLCFLPVSLTLVLAQDSILLLTVMIAAFVALDRGQEIRSGMLLGLGIFKFQYLLPIALLFFMWRRWRVVSGLLVSGAAFRGAVDCYCRTLCDSRTGPNAIRYEHQPFQLHRAHEIRHIPRPHAKSSRTNLRDRAAVRGHAGPS